MTRMGWYARERAADRVARAAGGGLDLVSFWEEARDAIQQVVPYYLTPCWYTLDPASLLTTSHYDHGLIPELPPEWLVHEYSADDYNKLVDVARSRTGISTLHELTDGDPSKSKGWQMYVNPFGGDQQLLLALRTGSGQVWGVLALYREPGQPEFSEEEREFLSEISADLAEGARRALLLGEAFDPDGPDAPALIVLNGAGGIESLTPGAEQWLDELSDGAWQANERLPASLVAVTGRVLAAGRTERPSEVAIARVKSTSGRWVALHGAPLVGDGSPRVAVIIEPAHPARISPLLMIAYGLTEREQEISRLVLTGDSTAQIAKALHISAHTVQQHFQNIFDKTGVRSRRDLVTKVFFSHYEPRLRDNEGRAEAGRPLRGGPLPKPGGAVP
jgi:DNA-binding CsgD family transcriptional regulator